MAAILPIVMQIVGMMAQQDAARGAKHNIQDIPLYSTGSTNVTAFDPSTYGTGQSVLSPNFVQIDPTITGLRQSILGNLNKLYPQAGGIYGGLLGEAGQNQPGFINAAVNPLAQRLDYALGDIMKNQGRLGLRGTSLGNNELMSAFGDAGSALSDATARATATSLGLRGDLANQYFGSQSGILGQMENVNTDELRQELAALGLQQQTIANMVARQDLLNRAAGAGAAGLGQGIMGLGGAIKGLLAGGGGGGAVGAS